MNKLHRSLFLKELKTAFPQLRSDLNHADDLLHSETDVFMRFVRTLIDTGDKDALVTALQIADKFLRHGNGKLVNALTVSFLEHLNFEDGKVLRGWAWECMTPALKEQYQAIMEYKAELSPSGRHQRANHAGNSLHG
jgi:hypothetical protein